MNLIDKNRIITEPKSKSAMGFTLIELLVVIAMVTILIGLLLPAVQKVRESNAAQKAGVDLKLVGDAANYYRSKVGRYPDSLPQLAQFLKSNPSSRFAIDPALAAGKKNGYLFEIAKTETGQSKIEAEPEFPGITGSKTLILMPSIERENIYKSIQTPGADQARDRMFNNIRAKAAETAVKLIRLGSPAPAEVRQFVDQASASPESILTAAALDADRDGKISIDEIRSYDDPNMDSSLKKPIRDLINYVGLEMKWGSLSSEESRAVAVGVTEFRQSADGAVEPPLFSYEGLSKLTKTYASDAAIAELLCEKLKAASVAEANGDLRSRDEALESYNTLVKAQIGQTLTSNSGTTLIVVLEYLIVY